MKRNRSAKFFKYALNDIWLYSKTIFIIIQFIYLHAFSLRKSTLIPSNFTIYFFLFSVKVKDNNYKFSNVCFSLEDLRQSKSNEHGFGDESSMRHNLCLKVSVLNCMMGVFKDACGLQSLETLKESLKTLTILPTKSKANARIDCTI